jgi:hypothetical protein
MAKATGEMIKRAFQLQDKGLSGVKIREELKNSNIPAYLRIRPILEKGEMPPDKGNAYSLPSCRDYLDNYRNEPDFKADNPEPRADYEALCVRVSYELGETARKAIDGLLALVGVKL